MHESPDRALPPFEELRSTHPFPSRQDRTWVHVLLLLLTFASTTLIGALHYWSFRRGFNANPSEVLDLSSWTFYLPGLWYSATVLAILGCHEMGHYLACRYYRVDVSLPFFLPAPPPVLSGTLGAFIRIRERIPSKIALFDIGLSPRSRRCRDRSRPRRHGSRWETTRAACRRCG